MSNEMHQKRPFCEDWVDLSNECKGATNLKLRLVRIFYEHIVDLPPSL